MKTFTLLYLLPALGGIISVTNGNPAPSFDLVDRVGEDGQEPQKRYERHLAFETPKGFPPAAATPSSSSVTIKDGGVEAVISFAGPIAPGTEMSLVKQVLPEADPMDNEIPTDTNKFVKEDQMYKDKVGESKLKNFVELAPPYQKRELLEFDMPPISAQYPMTTKTTMAGGEETAQVKDVAGNSQVTEATKDVAGADGRSVSVSIPLAATTASEVPMQVEGKEFKENVQTEAVQRNPVDKSQDKDAVMNDFFTKMMKDIVGDINRMGKVATIKKDEGRQLSGAPTAPESRNTQDLCSQVICDDAPSPLCHRKKQGEEQGSKVILIPGYDACCGEWVCPNADGSTFTHHGLQIMAGGGQSGRSKISSSSFTRTTNKAEIGKNMLNPFDVIFGRGGSCCRNERRFPPPFFSESPPPFMEIMPFGGFSRPFLAIGSRSLGISAKTESKHHHSSHTPNTNHYSGHNNNHLSHILLENSPMSSLLGGRPVNNVHNRQGSGFNGLSSLLSALLSPPLEAIIEVAVVDDAPESKSEVKTSAHTPPQFPVTLDLGFGPHGKSVNAFSSPQKSLNPIPRFPSTWFNRVTGNIEGRSFPLSPNLGRFPSESFARY